MGIASNEPIPTPIIHLPPVHSIEVHIPNKIGPGGGETFGILALHTIEILFLSMHVFHSKPEEISTLPRLMTAFIKHFFYVSLLKICL